MIRRGLPRFSGAKDFDVAIIGGGPGGYVAATRAAQKGLKTVCFDSRKTLGGTCLNVGCIPSKVLLNASHKYMDLKSLKKLGVQVDNPRVDLKTLMDFKSRTVAGLTRGIDSLFKKNGATFVNERASLVSPTEIKTSSGERYGAKYIIIASGSEPSPFPGKISLPVDGTRIVTSDHAIGFDEIPQNLVVVGGGVIGLELGSVWARLGSKVSVIDYSTAMSGADTDVASALVKSLQAKEGMQFLDHTSISGIEGNELAIETNGKSGTVTFDKLLVATGRRPVTRNMGLENLGIILDNRGHVEVNQNLQTKAQSNVFAIGDVAPGPMLAHKAEEEGIAVVDYIASGGEQSHFPNHLHIPSVVYTSPEVAWVGHREKDLVALGIKYRKGVFPFMANSRARCNGQTDGFVKVLVDDATDKLVGAHIISPHAGELIEPLVVGITYGASSHDIAMTSHAHPTESEAIKEACLAAHFKAIHF